MMTPLFSCELVDLGLDNMHVIDTDTESTSRKDQTCRDVVDELAKAS
jgi:hypothetical protein